ncbi:MAG TPA: radical SAM protein, partial [Dongiaceae bacterium]|nr:radical SAM protein [Dongiaceae bacterium]
CLHCPIPPVYGGRFFAVPRDVVLEDARRLIAAGAGHITFGDPDFLNGPTHAVKLVQALHAEFPGVTYDFTAKVEHILKHRELFREFGATGCAFVVSAVESLSDRVLAALEKGHTAADVPVALDIVRSAGVALRPSFVAFTPWTTLDDYRELLNFVETEDLIDDVDPIQFAIRLLVPPGSALLSRPALRPALGDLDAAAFTYRWTHPDPAMDRLEGEVRALVERSTAAAEGAREIFARVRDAAAAAANGAALRRTVAGSRARLAGRAPRLTEPWFCCAEPTERQLDAVGADRGTWM